MFGVTKAFFGVVETQGRGALHAHNLVWVRGMPPSVELVKEAMTSHPAFKARFEEWGKSCVVASLPLSQAVVSCSVCGGEMAPMDMPESAHRPAGKHSKEPHVARCKVEECRARATSTDILAVQASRHREMGRGGGDAGLVAQPRQHPSVKEPGVEVLQESGEPGADGGDTIAAPVNPESLALFCGSPVLPPWSLVGGYDTGGLSKMQAALCRVQLHSWKHVDSCFKKGAAAKKGCCRYVFPRSPTSGGFAKGVFQPQRLLGCEYVNPYNPLLYAVCRSNVDVRLLFNDKARAVVYYIVKYATKAQQEMEPGMADVLAHFEKRLTGGSASGQDVDIATRRVLSMAYNSSSRLQIPAPLAAMTVLGYPGRICSHKFGCLMLAQALQRFKGDPISGVLRLLRLPPASGGGVSAPPAEHPVHSGGGDGGSGSPRSSGRIAAIELADGPGNEERSRGEASDCGASAPRAAPVRRRAVVLDSFTEYSCRPTQLGEVNWYQYVQNWRQVKLPVKERGAAASFEELSSSSEDSDEDAPGRSVRALRYTEHHPLHQTHGLLRRHTPCVPRIYGPRLPDRDALVDEEAENNYAMSALVLFAPWRCEQDLLRDASSWHIAFVRTQFDAASLTQMAIMQSWYDAKKEADRDAAEEATLGGGTGGGEERDSDGDDEGLSRDLTMCGDVEGGTGALNFEEAALGAVAGEMVGVESPNATAVDPLVTHFLATGALGLLSGAICKAAAAPFDTADDLMSGWRGMLAAADPSMDKTYHPGKHADDTSCSGMPRIDHLSVDKEAAEMCARLRLGELDSASGDCGEDTDADGGSTSSGKPRITVQALREALCDTLPPATSASAPAPIPAAAPAGLSIGAVGGIFSLNELQLMAFSILALAVGRSMLRDLGGADEDLAAGSRPGLDGDCQNGAPEVSCTARQLLFYLGGEGGTGKTRVIDALRFFCASWGRPRAVLTSAFTGLAASAIGGSTLHSLVQLSGKGRRTPALPTAQQCAVFRGTLMVVVDEVSMLSAEQLAEAEGRLRLLMERDVDFGGLHMCLAGDFFQMPPIGAPFLFADIVTAHEAFVARRRATVAARVAAVRGSVGVATEVASVGRRDTNCGRPACRSPNDDGEGACNDCIALRGTASHDVGAQAVVLSARMHVQRRGFHLWRLFGDCVVLTENVRQREDAEYQAIVRAARVGAISDEMIERLNSRVVSSRLKDKSVSGEPAVVVYTNVVRTQMSQLLMGAAARGMPRRIVRLFAVVKQLGRTLSFAEKQALLGMPSQGTGELEMVLDVYCGLPVFVTKNLATELGVANGTRAVVVSVQFPERTGFRDHVVDGGGVVMVPSSAAQVVWIKVDGACASRGRLPCVHTDAVDGAFPVVMSKFRGQVRLPTQVGGGSVGLTVDQFPLTPAFFMTPYKLQGRTVSSLCVPSWPGSRCPSCTSYLLLSRPQQLSQLLLSEKLTKGAAKKYGPGRALLLEDARLRTLSASTVRKWGPRLQRAAARGLVCGMHTEPECGPRAAGDWVSVLPGALLPRPPARVPLTGYAPGVGGSQVCTPSERPRVARPASEPGPASRAWPTFRQGLRVADGQPSRGHRPLLRGFQVAPGRRLPSEPRRSPGMVIFSEPTPSECAAVQTAMAVGVAGAGEWDVVVRLPHVGGITRDDLRRFRPGGWLSGEGMTGIFMLLQERHDRRVAANSAVADCLFVSSYFYLHVAGGIFDQSPAVTIPHLRGRNVFRHRAVFIPVHEGIDHWFLAVVLPSAGIIMQFDSLGRHSDTVFRRLSLWLAFEARRCGHVVWPQLSSVCYDNRSPQQDNGDDCGFFVALTARLLADEMPLLFDASIMPQLRSRMAVDMLRGRID